MSLVAHVPELESVYISDSDVTSKGIAHLANLKKLRDLALWSTKIKSISALAGLTKLEKLGISPEYGVEMGDAGLEGLQNFVNLQDLDLGDDAIADETAKRLSTLSELRKLHISFRKLESEDSLAALSGLVKLESLGLHGPKLSDNALQHFARLEQLESLTFKISSGDGSGFRHLAGLKKLKHLSFSGPSVTDKAMDQLGGLKSLLSIMAQGSGVSIKGAKRLAAALPQVTIILDNDVIKSPRETYEFRRQPFNDSVSVLLPTHWFQRKSETLGAHEDGWQKINGWSGGVVGPAGMHLHADNQSKSAQAAVTATINYNAHLKPVVLKNDILPIAGIKDAASCIYRNNFGQYLVCAAQAGDEIVVLTCEAPPSRFAEFEPLFLYVAKSIRPSATIPPLFIRPRKRSKCRVHRLRDGSRVVPADSQTPEGQKIMLRKYESHRLTYSDPNEFRDAVRALGPELPPGVGERLLEKVDYLFRKLWFEDALQRLNGRTFSEILADDFDDLKKPIETDGEVERQVQISKLFDAENDRPEQCSKRRRRHTRLLNGASVLTPLASPQVQRSLPGSEKS